VKLTAALCSVALCVLSPRVPAAVAADGGGPEPQLALQYDFYSVEGAEVPDGSGHGHMGTLQAGEIVPGRNKPAVQFAGNGLLTTAGLGPDLDFTAQPLAVGAMCKPTSPDGVIVALGDAEDGFSLYLQGGVPQFAVRVKGVLHRVVAPEPVVLDQWAHVAGVIDAKGGLTLLVDTWPVAQSPGSLLARGSGEPLTVGADTGSLVGEYSTPLHWQGLLQDVRVYRGLVSREATRDLLGEWANRPGCGCRK
jgi:hypothetical protein